MGKSLQLAVAAFFMVQPMAGIAQSSKDERVHEPIGGSILWNAPLPSLKHDWNDFLLAGSIDAQRACGSRRGLPRGAYALTLTYGAKFSQAAQNALVNKMSVPEVCENGFPSEGQCLAFGKRIADEALSGEKGVVVDISCRKEGDERRVGTSAGRDEGGKPFAPYRFSGGTRF